MKELFRTNDLVLISAVEALFKGAEIHCMVADGNMSVLEGSAGALPRRVLVPVAAHDKARRLLRDAGLGYALPPA
jgi:putative signal transducing protein